MGQVAIPVVGSTSRKLGQPLVLQKRRPGFAADARRRMRRMELARPTTVEVVERDIMVWVLVVLSGAPQAVSVPGPQPVHSSAQDSPRWGPER